MSEPMMWLLVRGVWETLAMTFVSGFFGFVIGLPVGVLLYVTRPGQIIENAKLYRTLSALVNIFRSIPFIILLVWMIPFTRVIVGTSIGLQAAIVPLTVGAAPFIARMYGGKRPAGNPNRPDRSFPRYGCDANADRSQSSAARGAAWAGERSNHHAYHPGRLFRNGRRRRCWRFRPDWISVRLYWL